MLARELVKELRGGEILLLFGELGSGKTTFVQGLAKTLGVKELVTSPTFTIVAEYNLSPDKGGEGFGKLVHVDLYRLSTDEVARDPAVKEVLEQAGKKDRLTVIEWADRLDEGCLSANGEKVGVETGAQPKKMWRIKFSHGKNLEERTVVIETR
jgi:tRNA threonylcarbamoyladenosine biosynthesis protein TsaE